MALLLSLAVTAAIVIPTAITIYLCKLQPQLFLSTAATAVIIYGRPAPPQSQFLFLSSSLPTIIQHRCHCRCCCPRYGLSVHRMPPSIAITAVDCFVVLLSLPPSTDRWRRPIRGGGGIMKIMQKVEFFCVTKNTKAVTFDLYRNGRVISSHHNYYQFTIHLLKYDTC